MGWYYLSMVRVGNYIGLQGGHQVGLQGGPQGVLWGVLHRVESFQMDSGRLRLHTSHLTTQKLKVI